MIDPKALEHVYKWAFDATKNLLVFVGIEVLARKNNSDILRILSMALLGVYVFYTAYTAFDLLTKVPTVRRFIYGGGIIRSVVVMAPVYLFVIWAVYGIETELTAELIRVQLR